ncbi:hypothetical protein K7G42_03915 [Streptococcus parauberis]|uniref:Phage protein n=1 Tax=Streptococcus parauberis KRS-02083 TaxID=1207545 RepID=A0ABN0ITW3_9STRE|nr:hypothetical protein [Streptococcus parauberis]EMG26287.1 hypothetical protein SPJ1_0249 [Streptococcus parauberis KRS-02083]QBX18133.1 hypothetical protein Javan393_0053 [Streptococcus phage Javan393]WEM65778.1 hypothetical protein P1T45_03995 [Streptococcus parauberis]WOF47658.1 hypothetical protein K7G42_03915 [Streptococcus parauberis]
MELTIAQSLTVIAILLPLLIILLKSDNTITIETKEKVEEPEQWNPNYFGIVQQSGRIN